MEFTKDSIVNTIINSFINRSEIGQKKYNTTLDRDDLCIHDWINHVQEELMDAILYLEKLKKETHKTHKKQHKQTNKLFLDNKFKKKKQYMVFYCICIIINMNLSIIIPRVTYII